MSDNANRVEFTREMKKIYTIITPNMAPIHFELIKNVLESFGYHIDLLRTTGREIADEGLKYRPQRHLLPGAAVHRPADARPAQRQIRPAQGSPDYDPDRRRGAGPPTTSTCCARP